MFEFEDEFPCMVIIAIDAADVASIAERSEGDLDLEQESDWLPDMLFWLLDSKLLQSPDMFGASSEADESVSGW